MNYIIQSIRLLLIVCLTLGPFSEAYGWGAFSVGNTVVGGGAAPSYQFQDTFTGTNGDNIQGRSLEVGTATWTENVGNMDIQSNEANVITDGAGEALTHAASSFDTGLSDFTARVDIKHSDFGKTASNMVGGLMFRRQDGNNFWLAVIKGGAQEFELRKYVGGSKTNVVNTPFVPADNTWYTIEVVCSGTSITATLDGGNSINTTSSDFQSETIIGFEIASGIVYAGTGRFDNFEID